MRSLVHSEDISISRHIAHVFCRTREQCGNWSAGWRWREIRLALALAHLL